MTEIGVRVVNEDTERWAMVPAQNVMANIYCIIQNDIEEQQGCELEFKAGNLVTTMSQFDREGNEYLAATRLRGLL